MANSTGAEPSNELHSIGIFAKTVFMNVHGKWRLIPANEQLDVEPEGYDYLINIQDCNHLVHPDDIPLIKKLIANPHSITESRIKLRVITPQKNLMLLEGHGPVLNSIIKDTGSLVQEDDWLRKNFGIVFPDDDDIRRKAIEKIIAGKNLLEAVFNTSTLGLHVLQSVRNDHGEIVDFDILLTNATSDKIAGRKVSGLRMLEGWPHTREIGLFEKFVEVVKTGKKVQYDHLYEGEGIRAWFQWIASQLGDGLYVTIEDISERKKAEEAVKRTAARLQSTFDGVPAIIALLEVVLDDHRMPVDFIISAANKAASDLTGKDGNLIGQSLSDLYPEAFHGDLKESYLQVFKTGEPLHMEYLFPGLERWFSIIVTKQIDGQGIVVAALDITEQKKSEEQRQQNKLLSELNHAKTEFFSNVSHEFRTPLTLMLGPIQDMLSKSQTTSGYAEDLPKLRMVYRNALRLEKLVNTLLNFSRIEAGRSDAIFKPTDVAAYTVLLAGSFRSAIENAGLKFVVDCESTEPIYINQDMWEKIVLNLLSNAFKFTFEGEIEVRLRSFKTHIKLQIRDSGIGISPSNHDKIFERFTRIPNAKSRSYEGTGIGLAFVKELVGMHGGNIEISSKENQGTVFTVSIPKGKDHLPQKSIYEMKEKVAVSPLSSIYAYEAMSWLPLETEDKHGKFEPGSNKIHNHRKATVLLVDDNSDILEYIKSILGDQYIVATANNGVKALDLIGSGLRPDLVLADLMMPEMDGFRLLDKIRENKELAETTFIMITAKASEEDRIQGFRYGVNDYLVKPFSSRELLSLIDSRIQASSLRKQNLL